MGKKGEIPRERSILSTPSTNQQPDRIADLGEAVVGAKLLPMEDRGPYNIPVPDFDNLQPAPSGTPSILMSQETILAQQGLDATRLEGVREKLRREDIRYRKGRDGRVRDIDPWRSVAEAIEHVPPHELVKPVPSRPPLDL